MSRPAGLTGMRTPLLTAAALVGFAANSLLCRLALATQTVDPVSFTAVRMVSGATMLVLLALLARRKAARVEAQPSLAAAGDWWSAGALFAYAIGFSLAYQRIGAGPGALILFGAVQATMIGWGLVRGERPGVAEWLGWLLAVGGLAALTWRGANAVDALGAGLMSLAGIAWGVYSLRGRRALPAGTARAAPLEITAGNFLRAAPLALAVLPPALADLHVSPRGLALAVASGALASGVGYSLWYAALPQLSATRAAVVQLCVPVVAGAGAVVLLGEALTARLLGAGAAILGGIALAVFALPKPRPSASR